MVKVGGNIKIKLRSKKWLIKGGIREIRGWVYEERFWVERNIIKGINRIIEKREWERLWIERNIIKGINRIIEKREWKRDRKGKIDLEIKN
jgi:hypothetical protein